MRQYLIYSLIVAAAGSAVYYSAFNSKDSEVKTVSKQTQKNSSSVMSANMDKNLYDVVADSPETQVENKKTKREKKQIVSTAERKKMLKTLKNKNKVSPVVKNKIKKVVKTIESKKDTSDKVELKTAQTTTSVPVKKNKIKVEDEVSTKQSSSGQTNSMAMALLGQMPGQSRNKTTGNISFLGSTDFKQTTDTTKAYGSRLSLFVQHQYNSTYRFAFSTSMSKELSQGYEENLNNSAITAIHSPVSLTKKLMMIPIVSGIYPTSKVSKVRDEMYGALSVAPLFIYPLSNFVSFRYRPRLNVYVHKFETNRINQTNNQYLASQQAELMYSATDLIILSTSFQYVQTWSYAGTEKDPQYITDISGTYMFKNGTFAVAGVTTGGVLVDPEQGPDANIEFYDPNASSLYLMYGISL